MRCFRIGRFRSYRSFFNLSLAGRYVHRGSQRCGALGCPSCVSTRSRPGPIQSGPSRFVGGGLVQPIAPQITDLPPVPAPKSRCATKLRTTSIFTPTGASASNRAGSTTRDRRRIGLFCEFNPVHFGHQCAESNESVPQGSAERVRWSGFKWQCVDDLIPRSGRLPHQHRRYAVLRILRRRLWPVAPWSPTSKRSRSSGRKSQPDRHGIPRRVGRVFGSANVTDSEIKATPRAPVHGRQQIAPIPRRFTPSILGDPSSICRFRHHRFSHPRRLPHYRAAWFHTLRDDTNPTLLSGLLPGLGTWAAAGFRGGCRLLGPPQR